MCKTGFSNQKVESTEGLDIALMAAFTPRIGILLTHQTIDEHNDIIAGDIITIQTKCPAIQNLTGHLCPDRIKM